MFSPACLYYLLGGEGEKIFVKKAWICFWSVFAVILAGFGFVFWDVFWKDGPRTNAEQAKAAFSTFTQNWTNRQFAAMYEQLTLETKARVTKEQFIKRYQTIYEGIEASNIQISPVYNDNVRPVKMEPSPSTIASAWTPLSIRSLLQARRHWSRRHRAAAKAGISPGIRRFSFRASKSKTRRGRIRFRPSGEKSWIGRDGIWEQAGLTGSKTSSKTRSSFTARARQA